MTESIIMSTRLLNAISKSIDVKITNKEEEEPIRSRMCFYIATLDLSANVEFLSGVRPVWGNYFDLRAGEVSYHSGKQELTQDGRWKRDGRQVCKISKLLHHLTGQSTITAYPEPSAGNRPKMISRFVELLATESKCLDSTIEILVSDNPARIYGKPTAEEEAGTLGNSCMRPESEYDCHDQTMFYNAMNAHIAYIVDINGRLTCRALLWKGCQKRNGDSFNYMDRIYGTEISVALMKDWAHENGFAHKIEQTYNNSKLVTPEDTIIDEYSYEQITDWDHGFPYVDSLTNLTIMGNEFILDTSRGTYSLDNTDGRDVRDEDYDDEDDEEYDNDNEGCCYGCNCTYDYDNLREIDGENYCPDCREYSSFYGEYVIKDDCTYSAYHGCFIKDNEIVFTVSGSCYHEDADCIVEVNNQWYEKDSDKIAFCDYCDEYELEGNVNHYSQVEKDLCDGCVKEYMTENGYIFASDEWYKKDDEEIHLVEGTWYHEDDVAIELCDYCGGWHLKNNVQYYPQLYKIICDGCLPNAMAAENFVFRYGTWIESVVPLEDAA